MQFDYDGEKEFTMRTEEGIITENDLDDVSQEIRELFMDRHEKWKAGNNMIEREWRNNELLETDWMMIPDASFKGVDLEGSYYLHEVKAYRKALREYDLTYPNRPIKPKFL